jgi:hypothetical protein
VKEMKHTAEPWSNGDRHEVVSMLSDKLNAGYMIADCHGPEKELNAKRIIACVNACAGIDTEIIARNDNKVSILLNQRDDLLAVLNSISISIAEWKKNGSSCDLGYLLDIDSINETIAKCEK